MKKKIWRAILFMGIALMAHNRAFSQDCNCDHTIKNPKDPSITVINASSYKYSPGDVFCFEAGNWAGIRLIGFKGTLANPLVFKNCGGQVIVNSPIYSGIQFIESRYFRLTGTGNSSIKYGIKVASSGGGSSGVTIDGFSSDCEIDHLEIANTGFAGIIAKTDPNCNDPKTWRGNFTMYNVKIHNNFIHDTHGEGMYVGYTGGFDVSKKTCNGTMVFGHLIEGVRIYNNRLERTGWDGIQLNMAVKDVEVYNNEVIVYGTAKSTYQNFGMSLGGGSVGRYYNNRIYNSPEYAISVGVQIISNQGDTYFYNNIIENTGSYGIFNHQRMTDFDKTKGFYFVNNLIINPGLSGIFYNCPVLEVPNFFYNNVIVNPGTYYENSPVWKGVNENYIDFNSISMRDNAVLANNHFATSINSVGFKNVSSQDYHLTTGSPLINAGKDVSNLGINIDFEGLKRPAGGGFDIGPFEFNGTTAPTVKPPVYNNQLANQSATVEQNFTYSFPVNTFSDPQKQTLAYAANLQSGTGLPTWLKFNPSTRTFSGTPTKAETLSICVTATNTSGLSISGCFSLNIKSQNTPDPEPSNEYVNGIDYKYYEAEWTKLPDFESLIPKTTGVANTIDLAKSERDDRIGLKFNGFIKINTTAQYTFYLKCDDGGRLKVGNQTIITHDGLHGPTEKSGSIQLTPGYHPIEVEYFERTSGQFLEVYYSSTAISKTVIPASVLYRKKSQVATYSSGINYYYYEGNWNNLPDMKVLPVVDKGIISQIDLNKRKKNDYFGFLFDGYIKIPASKSYTFTLKCDDGGKLYIDNQLVINHDGLHPATEKTGEISLTAGYHPIKVEYFEKTGQQVLEIYYESTGMAKTLLPASLLFYKEGDSANGARIANTGEEGMTPLKLFPNPFTDSIILRGFTDQDLVEINIFNQLGEIITRRKVTVVAGSIELNLSNLKNGLYFLSINKGQKDAQIYKIIKH